MSASDNFLVAEAQLIAEKARSVKARKTKNVGEPIQMTGKALAISINGNNAWIAENNIVARKIDLESGKTLQTFHGHAGPVSALALWAGDSQKTDAYLITGSWDKSIRVWDTTTKNALIVKEAHSDFVKVLLPIPSLELLVSGGSDQLVRFWKLSVGHVPTSLGSISSHTRPVECLATHNITKESFDLFTADTMGIMRHWTVELESGIVPPRWKSTLKHEFDNHRTGINDLHIGMDQIWTASTDETVQVLPIALAPDSKPPPPITHRVAVRAILPLSLTDLGEPILLTGSGDVIRVYDISSPSEPELLNTIDAHWHDVTALRLWVRKTVGKEDGKTRIEPWIVSASLDGTLRRWRLSDLLKPTPAGEPKQQSAPLQPPPANKSALGLTEEEDRELDDLLNSDNED